MGRPLLAASLLSLTIACAPGHARAGGILPSGDPMGGPPDATPSGSGLTVILYPDPAKFVSPRDSSWLLSALEKQGYKAGNISYSSTAGDYSNDAYYAFADRAPGVHRYGLNGPGRNIPGEGGATINLDYEPSGSDPTGSAVHWIQVIYTNSPSAFGKAHGVDLGGGFYAYIDDARNPAGNPYYDNHGTANSKGFGDDPFRAPMPYLVWEAEVYTVTGTLGKTAATTMLDIEDGVRWGFTYTGPSVPEPSTLVLGGIATLAGLAASARGRGRNRK